MLWTVCNIEFPMHSMGVKNSCLFSKLLLLYLVSKWKYLKNQIEELFSIINFDFHHKEAKMLMCSIWTLAQKSRFAPDRIKGNTELLSINDFPLGALIQIYSSSEDETGDRLKLDENTTVKSSGINKKSWHLSVRRGQLLPFLMSMKSEIIASAFFNFDTILYFHDVNHNVSP